MFDPIPVCENGRCCIQLKGTPKEDCSICFECKEDKKLKYLSCKHSFHVKCINKWLKKNDTCPLCRTPVAMTIDEMIDKILAEMRILSDTSLVWPELVEPLSPIFSENEELLSPIRQLNNAEWTQTPTTPDLSFANSPTPNERPSSEWTHSERLRALDLLRLSAEDEFDLFMESLD